jgi:hypothetical protein
LTWSDAATLAVFLVLAAILAVTASKARACDLALTQSPSTVVINYNPFAAGPSSGAIDLGLRNQADEVCELRLSVVDDGGAIVSGLALGGVGVQFRPREASGLQTSDVEPGVFRYTLAGKATGQAQLDAAIVVDAVPDAGTYHGGAYALRRRSRVLIGRSAASFRRPGCVQPYAAARRSPCVRSSSSKVLIFSRSISGWMPPILW